MSASPSLIAVHAASPSDAALPPPAAPKDTVGAPRRRRRTRLVIRIFGLGKLTFSRDDEEDR